MKKKENRQEKTVSKLQSLQKKIQQNKVKVNGTLNDVSSYKL